MSEKRRLGEAGRTEFTSSSRVIYGGSCIVDSVHIAADGANADCQIYDGDNDKGRQKSHLEALSGTTENWNPGRGSRFDKGIYVVVNASTTKVSVTFEPVTDERSN